MHKIVAKIKSTPRIKATISITHKIDACINSRLVINGAEPYTGEYTVTPKAREGTTLKTKDKVMAKDVNVLEIPYYDVSNESGTTIFIASEVN